MGTTYIDQNMTKDAGDYPILKQQKVTYLTDDTQGLMVFDGKTQYCIKCKCGYVCKSQTPHHHQCHFYRWRKLNMEMEITPTKRVPRVVLWLEFGKRLNTPKMLKKWKKDGGYYLPSWLSDAGKTVFVPCEVGEVLPPCA